MHKVPKLALGLGGILFVLGWVAVAGGGSTIVRITSNPFHKD